MAAEVTSVAEHADVLQYLLTGAVGVIAILIRRDIGRIERRGDIAMTTLFGSENDPSKGLVTRVAIGEERCKITHGDETPHRRATDAPYYGGNGRA